VEEVMTRTRFISFAEFGRFLKALGFIVKRGETAWVFEHRTKGLLVFRIYGEDEAVDEGDLCSTRKFLDLRGVAKAKDFDAFVQGAHAPA
jgi:hypothetical protein